MISRIDHLNIVVRDLEPAAAFFVRLGFKATAPAPLSGAWISDIVGLPEVRARYVVLKHSGSPTNIELICYDHPPSGAPEANIAAANAIGLRHLAFEVHDIESEVQRLSAAGITFLSPVHVYPKTGKKLVYFLGPEGILLELAEYPR